MRSAAVLLSVAVLIGCASGQSQDSSQQAAGHPDPELRIAQMTNVADAARNVTGGIPVQYRLAVHNTTTVPLQLKRIELQSQGDGAYTLQPMSRAYDQVIDAGATQTFDMWGSANVQFSTISGANGPVSIRMIVQFESPEGRFQTVSVQQVHASGGY
jgi:hypothetical protein